MKDELDYITTDNIQDARNVCELFKKEKLKNLIFSPVASSFGRACDSKECKFTKEQEDILRGLFDNLYNDYPDLFRKLLDYNNNLPVARDNCGAGWQHATISPTGTVKSCVMLDDEIAGMGSIYDQILSEIFNTSKSRFYANFSKKIDDESCEKCEFTDSCGNCIARMYLTNIGIKKQNGCM